jgi:hypothetical protein
VADPLTTASLVLLFGAGASSMSGGGKTPPSDGRWVFPLPAWRGYAPTRSQEYRAPDHHGCDLMYVRKAGGADAMWPSGLRGTGELAASHGNAKFFFPDSVYACAARDGTLWHVGQGGHGRFVVIDHGAPFATFYTHLSSCLFPALQRGAGGIRVKAGQPLGVVGFSSLDAARLMHLHFEVWYKGGSSSHVDPWPLLERAPLPEGKP